MTLMTLSDSLYNAILSWCTTVELGRMELVRNVPDVAWIEMAHKRAGDPWKRNKQGMRDMIIAVYQPQKPTYLPVRCFADHTDGTRAFGLDNGYRVRDHHVPGLRVDSIAWIDNTLLVCSQITGWAYTASWQPVCACLCVSGPVDFRGTVNGTVPVSAVPYPCTRIVQSSRRIAAWHVSGHVAVFVPSLQLVALFDTNTTSPQHMSVIGDIVCVSGYTWHNNEQKGTCPCDMRDSNGVCYTLNMVYKTKTQLYLS